MNSVYQQITESAHGQMFRDALERLYHTNSPTDCLAITTTFFELCRRAMALQDHPIIKMRESAVTIVDHMISEMLDYMHDETINWEIDDISDEAKMDAAKFLLTLD